MSHMKTASIADRGKWAEKEVEKHLKSLNEKYARFAYERLPDARAAGGRLKAALCDFLAWWERPDGHDSYLIEVKETKHDYRIAKDKLEQLPRMRKLRLAGAMGIVLIYHSSIDRWRGAPLEYFDGNIPPSWDLRELPTCATLAEALQSSWVPFPT